MSSYTQLTKEQRYQIYALRCAENNQSETARVLGVHRSTISREVRRNKGDRGYRPEGAHRKALAKREKTAKNAARFTSEDWEKVERMVRRDWSPEQISGRMRKEGTLSISHESIYLHIYADKATGGDLWEHLRCQKKRRKRYGSGKNRRGIIPGRVGIEKRPKIVEKRSRIGDWEGDTVIGKSHKGVIVTLTERKSRFLASSKLASKEAAQTAISVNEMLKPYPDRRYTITFDNGKEFAQHGQMSSELNVDVFFANPYHSWERGLNENTNGLLRQYFPKGTDFRNVTNREVQESVEKINHRPRKCLNFKSPYEVFFKTRMRYTDIREIVNVALRT